MLDPAWPATPVILWLAFAALLAVLVLRAVRKDRLEYRRFKRYRSTARRQAMFRTWLRESFLTFGGLSAVVLLLAGGFVMPLLAEVVAWPGVSDLRRVMADNVVPTAGIIIGVAVGSVALLGFAVRAARQEGEGVMAIGDIQAMLPRNRQELRLGALLSINAGVVEELLFRFAVPALLFGASGNAVVAIVASLLLFGALHLYQGVAGVVGTTVVGAIMMLAYVVSGSILLPIVLHALFDLRSLVLIPVAVSRVHRIDGASRAPTATTGEPAARTVPGTRPDPPAAR